MTRATQPNQRCLTLAHRLQAIIAANVTNGVAQLQTERVMASVGPAKGESVRVSGSGISKPTERNATEVELLTHKIADIHDAIDGVEIAIKHLDKLASEAVRTRAFQKELSDREMEAEDQPRCRDNQHGRQGTIEWGRPDCLELPTKAGLCDACYHRERRWRKAHELQPRDIEAAA